MREAEFRVEPFVDGEIELALERTKRLEVTKVKDPHRRWRNDADYRGSTKRASKKKASEPA